MSNNNNSNVPNRRGREDSIMNFLDDITSVDHSLFPTNDNRNNNHTTTNTLMNNNNNNFHRNIQPQSQQQQQDFFNDDNNNNNNMMMMMMPTSKAPNNSAMINNTNKKFPPLNTSNFIQTKIHFNPSNRVQQQPQTNNNNHNFNQKQIPPAQPPTGNRNNNPPTTIPENITNENVAYDFEGDNNNGNSNIDHQKDHRSLKQYLFISYLKQIRELWNSRRLIRADKNRQRTIMFGENYQNNNMLVLSSDEDDDVTGNNNNNNDDNNTNGLEFLQNNNNNNNKPKNKNELNYDDDDDAENNNPNATISATILEKRTPVSVDIDMLKVLAISPIIGRKLAEDPESLFYNLLPSSLQGIVEEAVQELQLIRNKVRGRETEADKRIIITPANSHLPLLEKVLLFGMQTTLNQNLQQQPQPHNPTTTTSSSSASFRLLLNPLDDFPDLIKLLKPLRATQNICFRPQHLPPYFDVNAHEFSYSRHNNRLVVVRGTVIRHTPTRLVQYKVQYKCPSCEAGNGEPLISALSQRLQGTNKPSCKKCKSRPPMIPDQEWCKDYAECFVQRQNNNNNQQQQQQSSGNESNGNKNNENSEKESNNINNNGNQSSTDANNNNFGGTLVIDDLVERRALRRRRRLRREKLERRKKRQEMKNQNSSQDYLLNTSADESGEDHIDDDEDDDEDDENYDKPLFTDSEESEDSGDEEFYSKLEKQIREAEIEKNKKNKNKNQKNDDENDDADSGKNDDNNNKNQASSALSSLNTADGGFTSKLPRSILVSLEDDLVRTCYPGLLVEITGICIARWITAANGFTPDVQLMVHALNVTPLSQQNQIASGQTFASQRYFKNQKQVQRESNRIVFGGSEGTAASNNNGMMMENNGKKTNSQLLNTGTSSSCPIEVDDQFDDDDDENNSNDNNNLLNSESRNNNNKKSNMINSSVIGNFNEGRTMVLKSIDHTSHNSAATLSIVTLSDEKIASRLMNDRHAKAMEETSYCIDEIWKSPKHICSEAEEEHITRQMFRHRLDPADHEIRDVFRLEKRMETHRKVDDGELDRTPICYLTRRLHSNPFAPPPEHLRLFSESVFQQMNVFAGADAADQEFFSRQRAILLALRKQEQHHMSLCLTQFVRSRLLSEDEVHSVCENTRNFAVQLDQEVTHSSENQHHHHNTLPNYFDRIKMYEQECQQNGGVKKKQQVEYGDCSNKSDGEEQICHMKKQVKLLQVFLKNFQLATDYQLPEFIGPDLFRTRLVLSVAPQLTGRFAERLSVLLCTIGGVRRQQNFENLRGLAIEKLHHLEHEIAIIQQQQQQQQQQKQRNNTSNRSNNSITIQQKKLETVQLIRSLISEIDRLHSLQNDTSVNSRSNIHLLFCGDPATGKSQILLASNVIALTSVYVMGVGTTSAGLTAAASKESGEWTLDPGALVLSNGGTCVIDELRTVSRDDRNSLHEAMEQQTVSCAKAGMVTSLRTDCSVVAACNPVQVRGRRGMMDGAEMMMKGTRLISIGVGSPLLSRFDLIFAMFDSGRFDDVIASHILTLNCMTIGQQQQQQRHHHNSRSSNNNNSPSSKYGNDGSDENLNNEDDASSSIDFNNMRRPESPAFNVNQLRDYCAVCRQRCHHLRTVWWGNESELDRNLRLFKEHGGLNVDLSLSDDAANLIDCYYKIQRAESQNRGGNGTMILEDTLLVTIRFLESLVRLTQAHAALVGRADICLEEDAAMAILLTEQSARAIKFDLFASTYPSSAHLFEKVRHATTETEREKLLEQDEFVRDPMLKIAVTMPYSNSNCDRWFLGTDTEHTEAQRRILQRLTEVVKTHSSVLHEQNERNLHRQGNFNHDNGNNNKNSEEEYDLDQDNIHERMNQAYRNAHQDSADELQFVNNNNNKLTQNNRNNNNKSSNLLNFTSNNNNNDNDDDADNGVTDGLVFQDDFTGKRFDQDELDDFDVAENNNSAKKPTTNKNLLSQTFPGFMSSSKKQQQQQSQNIQNKIYNNNNFSFDPSASGFDHNGMKLVSIPSSEIQQEMLRFGRRQASGEDDEAARNLLSQVSTCSRGSNNNIRSKNQLIKNNNNNNNNNLNQRLKSFLQPEQALLTSSNNNSASVTPQFGLSQQSNQSNKSKNDNKFPFRNNHSKNNEQQRLSSSSDLGGGPSSPGGQTQCGDD